MASRFEKFSERARRALTRAQEEAQHFGHNYIDTEHILLGLIAEEDSVASQVLNNLGVATSKVRSAVEFIVGRGGRPNTNEVGLTPRAKKVIELALDKRVDATVTGPMTSSDSHCVSKTKCTSPSVASRPSSCKALASGDMPKERRMR
jgi:ATP-dependent Clp protease ATP-binding subunit ClpA